MTSWTLSIDFGTSYTVAAAKVEQRDPEVVEIRGERRVPSVLMIADDGAIVVGRAADDLAVSHPARTLRALKSRLGDAAPVVVAGRPYQVSVLVAALLGDVHEQVVRQMGGPPTEVRLTHPATWNTPQRNRLVEAAAKAGILSPVLIAEPVAAAVSFASEIGLLDGQKIAVYDLGGGTFDSAVLVRRGEGFDVVGRAGGDQNIGGELFDELVVNHIGAQLDPDSWGHIQVADSEQWQQVAATLRNEARRAKESLAVNSFVNILLPLPTGMRQVRMTRDELDAIIAPYVAETVIVLQRCIRDAGSRPADLAGISLVGGSSRLPIVEKLVSDGFAGVVISRRGDPKAAVALGAARAHRSTTVEGNRPAERPTKGASPGTAAEVVRLAPPAPPVASPGRVNAVFAPPPSPAAVLYSPPPAEGPVVARAIPRWLLPVALGVVAFVVVGVFILFNGDDAQTETSRDTSTTEAVDVSTPPAVAFGSEPQPEPDGQTGSDTEESSVVDSVVDSVGGQRPCPAGDGSSQQVQTFSAPPPQCIDPTKAYTMEVSTSHGNYTAVLDPVAAPITVNSFVYLARYRYFNDTVCHRVVPDFVVQCGDPTATGAGGPGYEFVDERPAAGQYKLGSIAMANAGPDTNGSQFFVISGEQGLSLPPDYTLFGQITDGLDTISMINSLAVGDGATSETVTILSVVISEN